MGLIIFIGQFVLAGEAEFNKRIEENQTFEQKFIESNIAFSNWLDGVADGLDVFLVGERLTTEPNRTNVKIENATYSSEGQGLSNATNLNVNMRLPNLEHYWQLKFTTYDETDENRSIKTGYLRQTPREKNYGATIGLFRKLGKVRTSFQPRISLENPLKVSHLLRFESIADYGTYRVNPKVELYADATKGPGIFWNLNFNFELTKIFSFTLINEANYQDKLHAYTAGNGFSFGEFVNPTSALAYTLMFTSLNQPSYHLDSYSVSIAWSQLLYKKILDYQLVPHLDFAKDQSFVGRAGLTFNLNLNF